jgi:hypothetical protein
MDTLVKTAVATIIIGVTATLVIDIWGYARKPLLGVSAPNYGLVGRWIAHMRHGQFHHAAIARSPPVRGEHLLGWVAHYLIGIVFAAFLIALTGQRWLLVPALAPALIVGILTVAAPFLLMQPGMGMGIAAAGTPQPGTARLHSLLTHTIFGLGLYLGGLLAQKLNVIPL